MCTLDCAQFFVRTAAGVPLVKNFDQEHPTGRAREDLRRNSRSWASRRQKCVVRRSIGSNGRNNTGAGSASSLARSGAWFFPEGDEVIGEVAAAGCRNQPGEKSEFRIAGRPMPSRREGKRPFQGHPNTSKEKRTRTSTLKL